MIYTAISILTCDFYRGYTNNGVNYAKKVLLDCHDVSVFYFLHY
jgi:hypothetical protein